jgi:hypothetical protein
MKLSDHFTTIKLTVADTTDLRFLTELASVLKKIYKKMDCYDMALTSAYGRVPVQIVKSKRREKRLIVAAEVTPFPGDTPYGISQSINAAIALSKILKSAPVTFAMNDIPITVVASDKGKEVLHEYNMLKQFRSIPQKPSKRPFKRETKPSA